MESKELTELRRQRDELLRALQHIAKAFGNPNLPPNIIAANAENAARRSQCLSAIEAKFFTETLRDEDGEYDECPLGWAVGPVTYVEQFGAALADRDRRAAANAGDRPCYGASKPDQQCPCRTCAAEKAGGLAAAIRNLCCNEFHAGSPNKEVRMAYGRGYRKAREEAAELAAAQDRTPAADAGDL